MVRPDRPTAPRSTGRTTLDPRIPAAQQCGKGVHVDAHLDESVGDVNAVYPSGCSATLTPGLKLLSFFFFDLASCIQDETEPPKPPAVK